MAAPPPTAWPNVPRKSPPNLLPNTRHWSLLCANLRVFWAIWEYKINGVRSGYATRTACCVFGPDAPLTKDKGGPQPAFGMEPGVLPAVRPAPGRLALWEGQHGRFFT